MKIRYPRETLVMAVAFGAVIGWIIADIIKVIMY